MPPYGGCRLLMRSPAARSIVIVTMAVVLALVPYGARFEYSPALDGIGACVVKSDAYGVNLANPNYYAFIESCATAAGLSVADYVATVCGIGTAVTGAQYATSNIIQLGRDAGDAAADNLVAIMDAAGQPRWEDLTASEQTAYGTKENYNAQQFVNFSDSIGLGTARDGFLGSGGHTFDDGEIEILQRIGRIGNGWLVGETFPFSEVSACMPSPNDYIQYVSGGTYVESDLLNGQRLTYYTGTEVKWWRLYNTWYGQTDQYLGNVNICIYRMAADPNTYEYVVSSPNDVNWGSNSGTNSNPTDFLPNPSSWNNNLSKIVYETKDVYMNKWIGFTSNAALKSNIPYITLDGNYSDYSSKVADRGSMHKYIAYAMLYGQKTYEQIEGTPENIIDNPPDAEQVPAVQYPENGINEDTTYPELIGEPTANPPYVPPGPDERPENPYNPPDTDNPSYQSGTPEWKQETSENMMPLLNVRLDRLFPFCLVYDLQLLWGRFNGIVLRDGTLAGQTMESFTQLVIPIDIVAPVLGIDIHTTFELDLNPLHDLLLITKPFVFILLVVMLLTSIIAFWKRILTGG